MVGKGTWEDPKRPAIVREAGVPFSFQSSDDGTMALVEVSPRNVLEMQKLEEQLKKEPRAKLFRPGKDKLADAVAEFRKWKRDFDPSTFQKAGGAPSVLPEPAPQTGK